MKLGQEKVTPKKCIFCGGGGMSREHILSDWLKQLLPRAANHTHISNLSIQRKLVWQKAELKNRPLLSKKIRSVCKKCNNGWMSKIVNDSKTIASSLIKGEEHLIDEDAQEKLAAWIALSVTMGDITRPETSAVSLAERNELYTTKLPPNSFTICIGRYSGGVWAPSRFRHHGGFVSDSASQKGPNLPGSSESNSQLTVFVLGQFLAFVFSSRKAHYVDRFRTNCIPDGLLTLWPKAGLSISWPCTPLLDDSRFTIADASMYKYLQKMGTFP